MNDRLTEEKKCVGLWTAAITTAPILTEDETSSTAKHRENCEYADVGMNCAADLANLLIKVHTAEPQTNAQLLKGSRIENSQQTQPSTPKSLR